MIIAFTGPKGSGKTTAARILSDRGWYRTSFAQPLRVVVHHLYDIPHHYMADPKLKEKKIERLGKSPRQIMQELQGPLKDIYQNVFVDSLARRIKYTKKVVIDDLRFDFEADYLKSINTKIVYVDNGTKFTREHVSEMGIDSKYIDYTLDNTGTEYRLAAELYKLVGWDELWN